MKSAGISLFFVAVYAIAQQSTRSTPYDNWLNEDVVYIITDQERSAFVQLQTDEERARFIENFWLRRDTTPDTIENEFREEHYRRIAYANEKFGSSMPGWKSDRGRFYVTYGPPDEIENGQPERPPEEGTDVIPVQKWRYRWIEDVGPDVLIYFADPTMTGDFQMTFDPAEKGPRAVWRDSTSGILEQMGLDRPGPLGTPDFGPPQVEKGIRLEQFIGPMRRPKTKFPDLKAKLYSRILYFIWPFRASVESLPVTSATALTYVTVQFENKDLQLTSKDAVSSANIRMLGEFTTLDGRVVESFEGDFPINAGPTDLRAEWRESVSVIQKIVPLRPGTYRLELVCEDTVSGASNNFNKTITVPSLAPYTLSASALILADNIETVPIHSIGAGQFVIGDSKVRPRIGGSFRRDETLGVYMQLYNLGNLQGQAAYEVLNAGPGDVVISTIEDIAKIPEASASQATLQKRLPLKDLSPGAYAVRLTITNSDRHQIFSTSAPFTVASPVEFKRR